MNAYGYPDGTQVFCCEHTQALKDADSNHVAFMSLYAGEHVRFEICRLCSTLFLGAIVSNRIMAATKEAIR